MKKTLAIAFLLPLFLFAPSNAENLEITNTSGNSGSSYMTIWIHNAPNEVNSFEFRLDRSSDAVEISVGVPPATGLLYKNTSETPAIISGSGYIGLRVNMKEPIPKGMSGPIARFTIRAGSTPASDEVKFKSLSGDIAGWSTKNGAFTYIPGNSMTPVPEAGDNQVVMTRAILDATQAYDTDGSIVSWDWELYHRINQTRNRTASGRSVLITDLGPGIYDVVLTVTDNSGIFASDLITLSVSGDKQIMGDANGNNHLDLGDSIQILKTLSGI